MHKTSLQQTRATALPVGQVVMSSITLAELEYGLHRKGQPARLRNTMTLVSRDKAFAQVPAGPAYRLKLEVW